MKVVAQQERVRQMLPALTKEGVTDGGWTTRFVDPSTGDRWLHYYLGSSHHGGRMPVLIKEPMPDVRALLDLFAGSSDPSEIAAAAWLFTELDLEGSHKEALLTIAEDAARQGDGQRAALLVGWGLLTDDANLRPKIGKHISEITSDHEYFIALAERAKRLIDATTTSVKLRNYDVFGWR